MRPNLRIEADSLFSSPYRSRETSNSSFSPLPGSAGEKPSTYSSSSNSDNDPTTPLLPPTPSMAEKGRESFPFPHAQRHGMFSRVRMALGGHRGSATRRVMWVITMAGILLFIVQKSINVSTVPMPFETDPKVLFALIPKSGHSWPRCLGRRVSVKVALAWFTAAWRWLIGPRVETGSRRIEGDRHCFCCSARRGDPPREVRCVEERTRRTWRAPRGNRAWRLYAMESGGTLSIGGLAYE